MKLLTTAVLISSVLICYNAVADCTTYECKKKAALADKAISEPARKELKEYYEKSDKLYNECKDKRKELRSGLSEDAKKGMAKHHKRNKKQTKPESKV